ncbi:sufe-like protein 1 [Quercus suber]|uniref:Sufe-like protein 1 n=1 Tax=Quercus suber TaxID=58331 RepID=A0AAW0JXV8_QUESU
MGSRVVVTRANRIKAKLQSALEATALEIDDVSYQHAGHAAVRASSAEGQSETHFNVKIVSPSSTDRASSNAIVWSMMLLPTSFTLVYTLFLLSLTHPKKLKPKPKPKTQYPINNQ